MSSSKTVIFTAVQIESQAVRRQLSNLLERPIDQYTIGIGARRLPEESLIHGATAIILGGLAGALDRGLLVGDVVVDDPERLVPEGVTLRRGEILTVDQIISTPEQKAELFQRTKALAVEMEGAAVRAFAEKLGIPMISVRAISDAADEVLDPAVVRFVDEVGRVRPLKLAGGLIRRPGLVPYLNRLGKNSRLAAEQLGKAVRQIVDALAESDGDPKPETRNPNQ